MSADRSAPLAYAMTIARCCGVTNTSWPEGAGGLSAAFLTEKASSDDALLLNFCTDTSHTKGLLKKGGTAKGKNRCSACRVSS